MFLSHEQRARYLIYLCAGWVLCRYIVNVISSLGRGVIKFDSKSRYSNLQKHLLVHQNLDTNSIKPAKISLNDAATFCVVQGILPLSFTYNNPAMINFASVLIHIGIMLDKSVSVDVSKLLPSSNTVRVDVSHLAAAHESFVGIKFQNFYRLVHGSM